MPLILKGVQCWEDALQAYDAGMAGVVLSNHGGRQLDFARSGIEILAEVVEELGKQRGLKFPNEKFQLFVDGGVRRATDVLKAVAMGATAGKLNSIGQNIGGCFAERVGQLALDVRSSTPIQHMDKKVLRRL
jgi:isopentenyl diphosphate isomerase/L-lactate dehydrogenase-like FMN-dependent dehydrogenase